jgi:hypothetical protein
MNTAICTLCALVVFAILSYCGLVASMVRWRRVYQYYTRNW